MSVNGQAPTMQNLTDSYLEHSTMLFEQMHGQMSKAGESLFPIPGFPAAKR